MGQPIYEKRVVALLDILGFKSLIENGNEQKVYDAVNTSHSYAKGSESYGGLTLTITAFSDTIVISDALRSGGIKSVIFHAGLISWSFLQQGIFTRGGIASGDMHHTCDGIFGRALNEAHLLESQLAIYPRIIVSDEIREQILCENSEAGAEPLLCCDPKMIRQDFDGEWHIHLMNPHINGPFHFHAHSKADYFYKKVEILRKALANPNPDCRDDKRARAKHNWLTSYLRESINEGPLY